MSRVQEQQDPEEDHLEGGDKEEEHQGQDDEEEEQHSPVMQDARGRRRGPLWRLRRAAKEVLGDSKKVCHHALDLTC